MSFTSNIKNEISNIEYGESEKMSELSAILNIGVRLFDDRFEIYTENISVARRIYKLIKETYHIDIDMDTSGVNSLTKNKQVLLERVCGSINDPKTSRYHAEFVVANEETANFVNKLLNELYFNSKVIKRDKNYMIYIKESEKISDFIKMLNATTSLFYYEDIRIYRDHKNMTNRLNNCEQAHTKQPNKNTTNKHQRKKQQNNTI